MFSKLSLVTVVLTTFVVYTFASAAFAVSPDPVELGTTSNFAVLAGTGITNTGTTTVSGTAGGDMGSHPTPAFTENEANPVNTTGTKYKTAEAVVEIAKEDLVKAYNDAAGRTLATPIAAGGLNNKTLVAGVYSKAYELWI